MAANYTVNDIQKAYIAFFGRPGEPLGIAYWESVSSYNTMEQMYAHFAAADEYRAYYADFLDDAGNITDIPGLLNEVYHNLFGLGRDIEPGATGLGFWAPLLLSGAITIDNVVTEVLKGAQNSDLVSINSKLAAAIAFTAAAASADFDGYQGPADAVIAHAWLSDVVDASTQSAAIATLPSTIVEIVGSQPGSLYDLTPSADTVNGTTGDDTIIATNSTLTAGDRIHGNLPSASDVVKYYTNVDASHAAFEMDGVERFQVTADHKSTVRFDFSGTTGIKTVASYNSTGNVSFNQLREVPLVVEVQNVTEQGDVTVQIQNAAVAGASSVYLDLINNYNTGVGVITIGSVADANSGIETVNIRTSVAASTVAKLNVDMTTLTVAGDKDLVITDPLNGTERTIDAHTMTGNLTLNSTLTGASAVSYTGSQGVDTVTFATTTGDHTVLSGDGDDVITLGAGRDNVDLGDDDDTLNMITETLTVLDHIEGGTDNDTIVLHGAGIVDTTETFFVTGIENYTLTNSGATLYVTEKMVNTVDEGNVLTVNMGADGGDTVVMTEVGTANTLNVAIKGGGNNDLVVVNDAVMAGFASLNFGSGTGDTLKIIDGATLDAGDLANVSGLDIIELSSDLSNQTWVLDLAGLSLEVRVDPNVRAAGGYSKLILVNAGAGVHVYTTSNCAVLNADGTPYSGLASVETSLFFTETSDTDLFGTSGDDLFTANTIDQVQTGDNADGYDHVKGDRMLANFAVNDIHKGIDAFFNYATIANIEILEFNPTNAVLKDVSFRANSWSYFYDNDDYDFTTFITSSGNDSIEFAEYYSGKQYTADLRDGNDTVYDTSYDGGGSSVINFIAGKGNDNFVFFDSYSWDRGAGIDADHYNPGAGTDTLTLAGEYYNLGDDVFISSGDIADLVVTDDAKKVLYGDLERVVIGALTDNWGYDWYVDDVYVAVNNADLYDFTGGIDGLVGQANFDIEADYDVFFNASLVGDALEAVNVTIDSLDDGAVLAVGGAGNDTITIEGGYTAHYASVMYASDRAGIVGLRGGDTINLESLNQNEDNVVYKVSFDGGAQGEDGQAEQVGVVSAVQDNIHNFEVGLDKIVLSVRYTDEDYDDDGTDGDMVDGSYVQTSDVGNGFIGDSLSKGLQFDLATGDLLDIKSVDNSSNIDLDDVELAVFSLTALSDADLLDLSAVESEAAISAVNVHNSFFTVENVLLLAVQGVNDTGIYWFKSDGDADVEASELSLMGIVHDALLTSVDFIYA